MQTVLTSEIADGLSINGMSLIAKVLNEQGALICKVFADAKSSVMLRMSLGGGVPIYKGARAAARMMAQIGKLNVSVILAYFINKRVQLVFLNDPSDLPVKGVECGPRKCSSGVGSGKGASHDGQRQPLGFLKPVGN